MVRFANRDDFDWLKNVWKIAFNDPDEFINWNFEKNFSFENTLLAEKDGVPASNMQLMEHNIILRGTEYPINYVSGVATLPEFRKMGLVREMFQFSFEEMKKRNQHISLLIPFNYEFYEQFGYKQCYNKTCRYIKELPKEGVIGEEGDISGLIPVLDKLYKKEMRNKNGYALRKSGDWHKILEDTLKISKGKVILNNDKSGYAILALGDSGGWEIEEICGGLSMDFETEVKPQAMARIINPLPILKNMAENFKGEFTIKIHDENIKENNISLLIKDKTVTKVQGACDTEIDIKELAQFIFGFCEDKTGFFTKEDNYLRLIF